MLLYISLTTIFISFILAVFNWQVNKNAIFLSLGLTLISVYAIAHYFIIYGNDPFWIAIFLNNFTPTHLLIGPFIFFYVRGTLTNKSKLRKNDWAHFLPAIIHLLGVLPWYFKPWDEKLAIATQIMNNKNLILDFHYNLIFAPLASFFIRPMLLLAYIIISFFLVLSPTAKFKKQVHLIPQKQYKITHRWLLMLLSTLLIADIGFIAITVDSALTNPVDSFSKYIGIHQFTALIFSIMSIALLFFPQVLYGMPNYLPAKDELTPPLEKTENDKLKVKNTIDSTKEDPFVGLAERIISYMDTEKPYTDEDFSIENISKALHEPLNHISYCLNNILNTKFTALRMKYRVNYAKELLGDEKNQHFTIEAIAHKCGFSSRSTFYAAFKEITNITPKEYIIKLKK